MICLWQLWNYDFLCFIICHLISYPLHTIPTFIVFKTFLYNVNKEFNCMKIKGIYPHLERTRKNIIKQKCSNERLFDKISLYHACPQQLSPNDWLASKIKGIWGSLHWNEEYFKGPESCNTRREWNHATRGEYKIQSQPSSWQPPALLSLELIETPGVTFALFVAFVNAVFPSHCCCQML